LISVGHQPVDHGENQRADLEAVHVAVGADDDFVPAQIVQIEGVEVLVLLALNLHAAAQHLD
jgi:hypothetical protein